MPKMAGLVGKTVRGTLHLIGGTTVGAATLFYYRQRKQVRALLDLPGDGFILEVDLEGLELEESAGTTPFGMLSSGPRPKLEFRQAVSALSRAGNDHRVKGLIGLIGQSSTALGLAQVQELRDAVLQFRQASAAPTLAYTDAFGEGGSGGTAPYYLASAFGKVYMQPTGLLSFTGLATTIPFSRGLLDRIGIRPLVFKREAFKSAASYVTGTGFTADERKATISVLEDLTEQIVSGVARARGLTMAEVRTAMDAAPLMGAAAVKAGLLDGLLYRDQAFNAVMQLQRAGAANEAIDGVPQPASLPRVSLKRYVLANKAAQAQDQRHLLPLRSTLRDVQRLMQPNHHEDHDGDAAWARRQQHGSLANAHSKRCVAMVTLCGPVTQGPGNQAHTSRGPQINSLPVVQALDRASADPNIGAVVLRIDTPGGSAIASDAVHRAVQLVRQAGKPVIVSMGTLAASGGYYIAASATKILAQPGTLTGSIGVLAGKLDVSSFLRDQGINVETVQTGTNASAMSPFHDFTPAQARQVDVLVDQTYSFFLQRVAAGRGMALDKVKEVAKGRVWTGQQALELGLVDALGGVQDAILTAKQAAGLDRDAPVRSLYPPPPSPLGQLISGLLSTPPAAALASAEAVATAVMGPAVAPQLLAVLPMLTLAPVMLSLDAQLLAMVLHSRQ